jgi:hypothetical protein
MEAYSVQVKFLTVKGYFQSGNSVAGGQNSVKFALSKGPTKNTVWHLVKQQ